MNSDYSIGTPSPSSITVHPGGTATFALAFQSYDGLNPIAQLAYTGGPLLSGGAQALTFSPASIQVPAIGTLPQTITATAAPGTPFGTYALTITTPSGWALGSLTVTVTSPAPLTITTPSPLSPGILSLAYPLTFTATGGTPPYTWSLQSGSAAGLTLSSGGTLTGAPTASGNFTFTVQVTDSLGASATMSYGFGVAAAAFTPDPPELTTQFMFGTRVGVFRGGAAFLEDSNGNGVYDPGVDQWIPLFAPPGGNLPGDVPVVGDWTGDGVATKVGIYRPSTGFWYLDANNNGVYDPDNGDYTYQFGGLPGDMPFVGDWNGVMGTRAYKSCIGIYRSPQSQWLLDLNCNGVFDNTPTDAFFPFGGLAEDVPVVGNWTGTHTRVGVVRAYAPLGVPITPPYFWVMDGSPGNAGNLPANHQPAANCFPFGGLPGDVFVTGDWLANGASYAGVYRVGHWLLDTAAPTDSTISDHWNADERHAPLWLAYGGSPGDVPITGKWATPVTPASLGISQVSGTAAAPTFTASWNDPSGYPTNISWVQIAFEAPVTQGSPPPQDYETTVNGCGIMYITSPNGDMAGTLALSNPAPHAPGDPTYIAFPYTSAIGSAANGQPLSNGICVVDVANTKFATSPTIPLQFDGTATLTVPVTFINPQTTSYSMFTSATNMEAPGNNPYTSNWDYGGAWSAPASALISGQVGDGLAGVPAVMVTLGGSRTANTTTEANGNYFFIVPSGGSYNVAPAQAGYTFLPASLSFANLTSNVAANFNIASGTEPGTPGAEPPTDPTPTPTPPGDVSASTTDCNDISGIWSDPTGTTFSLFQSLGAVSGTETQPDPVCGTVKWQINGQSTGAGSFTLTSSSPSPPVDLCGQKVSSGSANIQITSCSSASETPIGSGGGAQARLSLAAASTSWTRTSTPLGIQLTANLYNNTVSCVLTGQNKTGNLSVAIRPTSGASTQLGQMSQVGPGTYPFSLQRLNLTPGNQYGTITATWDNSSLPLSVAFRVVGGTRFSTYNTPTESACSGTSVPAFVFSPLNVRGGCLFNATTLNSQFIGQMAVNDTGISTDFGLIKPWGDTWLKTSCPVPPLPGATESNTFVQISTVQGKCGSTLSGGVSLATNPSPTSGGTWACSDNVLLVNPSTDAVNSTRVVQDLCPLCSGDFRGQNAHIDAYSSAAACAPDALPDYGNFFSIRLR